MTEQPLTLPGLAAEASEAIAHFDTVVTHLGGVEKLAGKLVAIAKGGAVGLNRIECAALGYALSASTFLSVAAELARQQAGGPQSDEQIKHAAHSHNTRLGGRINHAV